MPSYRLPKELFYHSLPYLEEIKFKQYFRDFDINSALLVIKNNQKYEKLQNIDYSIKMKNMVILLALLCDLCSFNLDECEKLKSKFIVQIFNFNDNSSINLLFLIEISMVEAFFKLFLLTKAQNSCLVTSILKYVDQNIEQNLSIEKIAKDLGYSVSHISHAFKNNKNCTLKSFIVQKKLKFACDLLINTDFSVNEIQKRVHFSSKQHFYRIFKQNFGLLPNEYRTVNR